VHDATILCTWDIVLLLFPLVGGPQHHLQDICLVLVCLVVLGLVPVWVSGLGVSGLGDSYSSNICCCSSIIKELAFLSLYSESCLSFSLSQTCNFDNTIISLTMHHLLSSSPWLHSHPLLSTNGS